MTTFAKCDFTASDSTLLSAYTPNGDDVGSWSKESSQTGEMAVDTNRVYCSASNAWLLNSGTPAGANQTAKFTLRAKSQTLNTGVLLRADSTAKTGYTAFYWPGNGVLALSRWSAGSLIALDTVDFDPASDTDYEITLVCHDSYKKVFVNDVEWLTSADNTITATGQAGIWANTAVSSSTGTHIDSFQADDGAVLIAASPDDVTPGRETVLTLTGTNTTWLDDSAKFLVTSDCGASIISQSVQSNTSATVRVTSTGYGKLHLYTSASTLQRATITSTDVRIVVTGNSLFSHHRYSTSNIADNVNPVQQVIDALGGRARAYNYAVSGQSGINYTSPETFASYYDSQKRVNFLLLAEVINALKGGSSSATVISNYESVAASASSTGYTVIATTPTPRGDVTEPAYETARQAVATDFRTNSAFDAVADIAADANIGQDGDDQDTTYYLDTVHWTAAGATIAAGLITQAISDNIPTKPAVNLTSSGLGLLLTTGVS